jgi:hypothetical protein
MAAIYRTAIFIHQILFQGNSALYLHYIIIGKQLKAVLRQYLLGKLNIADPEYNAGIVYGVAYKSVYIVNIKAVFRQYPDCIGKTSRLIPKPDN